MMNTPRKCKISGKKRDPIRPSRPHAARRLEFTLPKAEQSQETSTILVLTTVSWKRGAWKKKRLWCNSSFSMETSKFWNEAASYVQQVGESQSLKRTGRRNQYQY